MPFYYPGENKCPITSKVIKNALYLPGENKSPIISQVRINALY